MSPQYRNYNFTDIILYGIYPYCDNDSVKQNLTFFNKDVRNGIMRKYPYDQMFIVMRKSSYYDIYGCKLYGKFPINKYFIKVKKYIKDDTRSSFNSNIEIIIKETENYVKFISIKHKDKIYVPDVKKLNDFNAIDKDNDKEIYNIDDAILYMKINFKYLIRDALYEEFNFESSFRSDDIKEIVYDAKICDIETAISEWYSYYCEKQKCIISIIFPRNLSPMDTRPFIGEINKFYTNDDSSSDLDKDYYSDIYDDLFDRDRNPFD